MAQVIDSEWKALLATRDQNIRDEVGKLINNISMPAALLFLYEFRLLHPHISTNPLVLEAEYRKALRKKEFDFLT